MNKRLLILLISIIFLFTSISGRLFYLMNFSSYMANDGYNSFAINVDTNDANIYYNDGTPITNNKKQFVAVILPNSKCITELNKLFSQSQIYSIVNELKNGYPIIKQVDKKYDTKYIRIIETPYTKTTLSQFISKESSGLLSYIETEKELKLAFNVDAMGRMLQGDSGKLKDNNYYSKEGILTTFDINMQNIAINASKNMDNGCIVIMDTSTGNVLASVVKPNKSYINKSIEQYSVGSVFKLIVTACALENNLDIKYNCTGSINVSDVTFNCSKGTNHGEQNLKQALSNSCNCYFVNLIQNLGKEKIINTSKKLGFFDKSIIFDNWEIKNSVFPSEKDLNSLGQLSMLGFGQGALTCSPLQICSALCTISDGFYKGVNVVNGKVNKNGIRKLDKKEKQNRALSSNTVNKLKEYMRYVVTDGTGYNAESNLKLSCGKTATAETGQYILGKQLYNTWFAGLYPYNNPKYAIVVMCENGSSGAEDCCPIFRTIVDMIDKI